MKVRRDFVTNSSSRSYVIDYHSLPAFDEETLAKYPCLKNYGKLIEKVLFAKGSDETTAGKMVCTKEEYDQWFLDYYGWRNTTLTELLADDEWLLERYTKAIEYLEKGFNILLKRVDHNDEYCERMLNELAADEENFVILEGE